MKRGPWRTCFLWMVTRSRTSISWKNLQKYGELNFKRLSGIVIALPKHSSPMHMECLAARDSVLFAKHLFSSGSSPVENSVTNFRPLPPPTAHIVQKGTNLKNKCPRTLGL